MSNIYVQEPPTLGKVFKDNDNNKCLHRLTDIISKGCFKHHFGWVGNWAVGQGMS